MSSAESSFPNQSSLLIPYHQQAYLFNSRQEMDLLALSQTELANQLKAYSSMQNPHALLNLAAISQKESPEKLLMSHTARGLSNGQMAGLLGMSLPSANDPFSNRLQASPMTNPLAKKMEDPMTTAAKMNFERGMPYNTTNQLNSIAQLLEANDLKAQAQKNMQELLYYQMQQNKMQMQNPGNVGYSVLLNSQNSLNYGGMVPNQGFYNGQIPTKKSPPGYYGQNVDFPEVEILSKKQVESQKALYKQMGGMNGLEAIVSQENETLLRNAKIPAKNIDELKLMSTEQITPYTPKQSVVQPSKQDVHFMNQPKTPKTPQSQLQSASSKGKQVIEEIVIQEDSDLPPQKEIKEVQQQTMVVEAPVATITEEPAVEAQNKDLLKPKIMDNAAIKKPTVTPPPTTATTTRKCFNRLCLTDVNNDSLWATQKVNNSSVCKVCCDAFNKGQYCHYCQQIYLDDETSASSDDKDWIECESCKTWNHIECETENGLKSLRILLEKNENYKYFCPNCRPNTNKSFRAPIKTANKIVSKNLSQSKASSPLNLTETDSQKTPVHHSKPNLEDGLVSEEGLKEPTIRKFRIQDGLKGEAGVQQTEVRVENLQEDMARKKLDYVFNKHQNSKKKLQGKIVYTPPENFSFIEKLLITYGKKIQLNEGEIKSDLDLFRELSLQTAQQINEKRAAARKEMEEEIVVTTTIVQTANLMIKEPAVVPNFVKSSGGPRNMRLKNKIQQKAAGNAAAAKQMVEETDSQDNDDYDQAGGRVLRNRKRLE